VTAPASSFALKVPQAPTLEQVTVHVTVALPSIAPLGNVAAADKVAAAFTASDVGGGDMNTTAVGFGGTGVAGASSPEPPQPAIAAAIRTQTIQCFIRFHPCEIWVLQQDNARIPNSGTDAREKVCHERVRVCREGAFALYAL
jgi:hypothetical protein